MIFIPIRISSKFQHFKNAKLNDFTVDIVNNYGTQSFAHVIGSLYSTMLKKKLMPYILFNLTRAQSMARLIICDDEETEESTKELLYNTDVGEYVKRLVENIKIYRTRNECKFFSGACENMGMLYNEDFSYFLNALVPHSTTFLHAFVLLSGDKLEYAGHIYGTSPFPKIEIGMNVGAPGGNLLQTVVFQVGGIRASLETALCKMNQNIKNFASNLFLGISIWLKKYQWEGIRIMFEPIGPMSSLANKMGMLRTNGWYTLRTNGWYTSVDDLYTFFENTIVTEPLEMNYTYDGY